MEIKRTTEFDAQVLTDLGRTTFIETFAKDNRQQDIHLYVSETFQKEKQLKEIQDPKRRIAIAWIDNQPAGFFHLLNGESDPSVVGAKPIEILRLYVDSKWHGKGVGVALMDECLKISKEEGYKTLWLGVWERNLRAQSFYKKYGFTTVGQHIFRLGSDNQTDLIMMRSL